MRIPTREVCGNAPVLQMNVKICLAGKVILFSDLQKGFFEDPKKKRF
jgi:hypothetical protein